MGPSVKPQKCQVFCWHFVHITAWWKLADSEVDEMLQETEPASIAQELKKHLPSELRHIRKQSGRRGL
jgi:hypothetical protein